MILKIIDNEGKEHAVQVYENNFNGDVEVQDTYFAEEVEYGLDTIFGTNEQMITIQLKKEFQL